MSLGLHLRASAGLLALVGDLSNQRRPRRSTSDARVPVMAAEAGAASAAWVARVGAVFGPTFDGTLDWSAASLWREESR